MNWHRRFANAIRVSRIERDLDREFAFHIAERAEELIAGGLSEGEAKARARRQFGNLTLQRERSREMYLLTWLSTVLRNLRIGVRSLLRVPLLSAAVVFTLALGIGANSAVFAVVDAILLRPLPFPDGDRLMLISQQNPKNPSPFVAPARLEDWNRMNSTFQALTGYYTEDVTETSGELAERMKRAFVAPRFLEVWGIAPALGRGFARAEERYGGPGVVLISDRLWRRRFGAAPNAIGKHLRFGATSPEVIGVMPASFRFSDPDVDLWWPVLPDSPITRNLREATWFTVVGRLKPGINLERARADLSLIQGRLGSQFPETDARLRVDIQPLKEQAVGGVRRSLWIVFGSVSLLLLIACANIAALLLSRAVQRRPEISIRVSLGASRLSVVGQLLMETAVLSVTGAVLGLPLAAAAPWALRRFAGALPRAAEFQLSWAVVAYSLGCAVLVALLCGLIPAIRSTGRGLSISKTQKSRGEIAGRSWPQWVLVGAQVALAVTLLAGAGLLIRSIQQLGRVAPGFDADRVLTFRISGSYAETSNYPALTNRIESTLDLLTRIPGVKGSATASMLPGIPAAPQQLELKFSDGPSAPDSKITVDSRPVSATYFSALRIPLLAGEFCPLQLSSTASPALMVNRSFANRYLGGLSGLGRHLQGLPNSAPGEIRGIVGDVRERGLGQEPAPTVYWCLTAPNPSPFFLVRTQGDPSALVPVIRKKLHETDPQRSVFDLAPLSERLDDAFAENRLRTVLLVVFAFAAVLLAGAGLYSSLSYLVTVRRREVGVRLALGAARGNIVKQFLLQGLGLTLAAIVAGMILAFGLTRLLVGMLYGVSPSDPFTLSLVALLVLAIGFVASLIPAMRASHVEPMAVLRQE
jgi:putative ABC transport system permease protein